MTACQLAASQPASQQASERRGGSRIEDGEWKMEEKEWRIGKRIEDRG